MFPSGGGASTRLPSGEPKYRVLVSRHELACALVSAQYGEQGEDVAD